MQKLFLVGHLLLSDWHFILDLNYQLKYYVGKTIIVILGVLQDFVVAMLCGLDSPVTSIQNAASWGYFNTVDKTWNTER